MDSSLLVTDLKGLPASLELCQEMILPLFWRQN